MALVVGVLALSVVALASAATLYDTVDHVGGPEGPNQASYWVTYGYDEFGEDWICEKRNIDDENNNLTAGAPPAGYIWGAIIVKQADLNYVFRDVVEGDILPTGGAYSHYIECWMEEPFTIEDVITVTKTAETSFDREHFWSIDKSVDPEELYLSIDGLGDGNVEWDVDVTYDGFTDSNFNVSGEIEIVNDSFFGADAVIGSVEDVLAGSLITVDCGVTFPYTLVSGDTLKCTYDEDVNEKIDGKNEVTVEAKLGAAVSYVPFEADAMITWGDPDSEENRLVSVTDTNDGFALAYPGSDADLDAHDYVEGEVIEFSYSDSFAFADFDECGTDQIVNTARVIGDDDVVLDDDTATLDIYIQCEGALTVTKTADTSFDREHFWSIEKSVDPEELYLYIDGSGDGVVEWFVDVTYDGFTDSNLLIAGVITIENTGALVARIDSVTDVLTMPSSESDLSALVDCGVSFPYELAVDDELECDYSFSPLFIEDGLNEGTATGAFLDEVFGNVPFSETGEDDVEFGDPESEKDRLVSVTDTNDGFALAYPGSDADLDAHDYVEGDVIEFSYSDSFAFAEFDECGSDQVVNTARVIGDDDVVLDDDTATLDIYIQCVVYNYETAYALDEGNETCFIPTFSNWGWTNRITEGTYVMDLWAAAGQCDTSNGTLVGTVTVVYAGGYVTFEFDVDDPYTLEETHEYAGSTMFPQRRGSNTVSPGQYYNDSPFADGADVHVIAHAVVGIPMPDPDFGPQ